MTPSRSRPRSATSGSSAFRTKRARPVALGDQLGPAVGQQLELAVAVELVAEQVARARAARVQRRAPPSGSQASSTSNRPSWSRVAAGVEQRGGHAPVHVRAGAVVHDRPPARAPGSPASIAAVVVLPLVADTSTGPASSRAASRPIARRSSRSSSAARAAWCRRCGRGGGSTARASAGERRASREHQPRGTMTRRQRGSTRDRRGRARRSGRRRRRW